MISPTVIRIFIAVIIGLIELSGDGNFGDTSALQEAGA
jgi:hypothetical protein